MYSRSLSAVARRIPSIAARPLRALSTTPQRLDLNKDALAKGHRAAKIAYNEEQKLRGGHDNDHGVEAAKKGQTGQIYSDMAKAGMDAKKQNDGQQATKTDSSYVSDSAPRPIIGLEDERGGFNRPASGGDFKKASKQRK